MLSAIRLSFKYRAVTVSKLPCGGGKALRFQEKLVQPILPETPSGSPLFAFSFPLFALHSKRTLFVKGMGKKKEMDRKSLEKSGKGVEKGGGTDAAASSFGED
jgi:hypothetical protein